MRATLVHSCGKVLTTAFLFSSLAVCVLAEEKEVTSSYSISLDEGSDRVTQAQAELLAALKLVVPPNERGKIVEKAEKPYLLYGDLFGNWKSYAIIELKEAVGFAAWSGNDWQLRGLWDIAPVWRTKGWKSSDEDYLPASPAEKPFWMKELSGDKVKEIVVAGLVDRYFQEFHLFRFDPASERLQWMNLSMAEPELERGYLRLHLRSGRRAEWEEHIFLRWIKGQLVSVASWREEVPYDNPNASFWGVVTYDSRGNEEARFRITSEDSKENEDVYVITRNGLAYSKVLIRWKKADRINLYRSEVALAFFFERLTWIPRSLYPAANKETPANVTLEKLAEIVVSGNPLKR